MFLARLGECAVFAARPETRRRRSSNDAMNRSKSVGRRDGRPREAKQYKVTVAVLGGERVGKSALVSQFLWQKFVSEYRATVEEFNWIEYEVEEGRVLMVQIIDSSGSRDFIGMRNLYIGTADAFMVVFAVNDPSSLIEARSTINEIVARRGPYVPIELVANKTDKEKLCDFDEHEQMNSGICYRECCAKNQEEARQCFQDLIARIRPTLNFQGGSLRKRRQSMPSSRAYSGVESRDIQKVRDSTRQNCLIS
ncbi:unnamed protein product [Caenorhabditis bovis]|uniref:GTP-binding protein Rhes n=1 Tax=Caenorhabditis bovis TaxID=2654633 RepID=A0A8S1F7D7_9PELO|nr:unnamed protein product [Caenorhabditis bovis]